MNNRLVNIWSHLVGAVAFGLLAGVASFTYLQRYPTSSQADILVFACFFGGAVMCLGMSATVHSPVLHPDVSVSYRDGTFPASNSMGRQVGLLGNHDPHNWLILSEHILWIL